MTELMAGRKEVTMTFMCPGATEQHVRPTTTDSSSSDPLAFLDDVTTISVHIVDGDGMPVPHGMELDRDTMQLLNCAEDSATGHNSKVCACIGMVLSHVGGAEVRTPEEADAAECAVTMAGSRYRYAWSTYHVAVVDAAARLWHHRSWG
eukprot:gene54335-968_t